MKAPSSSAAPQPQPGKREWSPSVRQYVQRAFAERNQIPGVTRSEMEMKLKEVISGAASSNTLDVVDWDNYPLPQQIVHDTRMSAPTVTKSNFQAEPTNTSSDAYHSKKRKSSDLETDAENHDRATLRQSPPPWRVKNPSTRPGYTNLADAKRLKVDKSVASFKDLDIGFDSRKRRFESRDNGYNSPRRVHNGQDEPQFMDMDNGPVVGRSTTLEKRYFRLTSAPNPEDVRPLHVLEQTLELLKKKWKRESNYSYICDQFKSLRQDLTVQHIKTEFTVTVYEIHARIALEKGDLGEYNQCQTQLSALYAQNLGGHPTEFKAYRILYFLYTCDRSGMNGVFANLTHTEKTASEVKHALEARSSLALGNYHRFFKLYHETPNMGAYLMDMFVDRERLAALANICKASVLHSALRRMLTLTGTNLMSSYAS